MKSQTAFDETNSEKSKGGSCSLLWVTLLNSVCACQGAYFRRRLAQVLSVSSTQVTKRSQ